MNVIRRMLQNCARRSDEIVSGAIPSQWQREQDRSLPPLECRSCIRELQSAHEQLANGAGFTSRQARCLAQMAGCIGITDRVPIPDSNNHLCMQLLNVFTFQLQLQERTAEQRPLKQQSHCCPESTVPATNHPKSQALHPKIVNPEPTFPCPILFPQPQSVACAPHAMAKGRQCCSHAIPNGFKNRDTKM